VTESFYGRVEQTIADDAVARYAEEIAVRGYTIMPALFSPEELAVWRQKIDTVYETQEREYGRDSLAAIQELDTCRAPLLYDFDFLKLAIHPAILSVVTKVIGDYFILNQQNVVLNRPNVAHHQAAWHRDLPYQNWVISRPLSLSSLLVIDEFSESSGGTHILPYSHKTERLPSDAYIETNQVAISAPAGSALVFDSMLFHRAGANRSKMTRRAANHLYTIPLLKQQYDFPKALGERNDLTPDIAQMLGYTSQVPIDDRSWRAARRARLLAKQ